MKKKAKKEQDVLEYMRSISNIPRYEPMKTTLIEWCEYWLSTRANNLKDSTRSSYECLTPQLSLILIMMMS